MKRIIKILAWLAGIIILLAVIFLLMIRIPAPEVNPEILPSAYVRKQIAPDHYQVNNCWLKKNKYGIWEMYLEGEPYERGVIYGVLAKELIEEQESYFVSQINELIPNKFYQQFLKFFVAWFNRDIDKHIPKENLQEIYGVSLSFSDKYDYVGPKYYRILNYHAAHDIGHALNDFHLVGCTSFAVNKEFSADSSLLIARNFDFYLGDDFAKKKLLIFVNPRQGYKYASYAWAGLTGVVSGMNEKGISVTINASKSDIPLGSKDPVSILAREILQYAKNVEEAVSIAEKRKTFVSESLLIGSAEDDKAVIIEKSPKKMDVYASSYDYLICANHYQGSVFMSDSVNLKNIMLSDSKSRYDRMNELLHANQPVSYEKAARILRNKEGQGGKNIGLANPRSINQLIAHHAVMLKPAKREMWVSAEPYQLGEFVCYDLDKLFKGDPHYILDSLNVAADSFLYTEDYKRYESFKATRQHIIKYVMFGIPFRLDEKEIAAFIGDNPQSFLTYMALGDYFQKQKQYQRAIDYYKESLKHETGSVNETEAIKQNIQTCSNALNK